jgi:hypothetical protein
VSARLHLVEEGEHPEPRVVCMCGEPVPAAQTQLGRILVTHCLKCCTNASPHGHGMTAEVLSAMALPGTPRPRRLTPWRSIGFVLVCVIAAIVGLLIGRP